MLKLKTEKSLEIINEALLRYHPKIAVVWSTNNDSTVMLSLVRQIDPNLMVIFGDTTQHFQETYDFRDRMTKDWKLKLINVIPDVSYDEVRGERQRCCRHLKTLPFLRVIKELDLKAVMIGLRWNDNSHRCEDYFSKRKKNSHYRVHPILHWTEREIQQFMNVYEIPHNPLYDKGYRSIGCKPCTKPEPPRFRGRFVTAKNKEEIMARLRKLGYW